MSGLLRTTDSGAVWPSWLSAPRVIAAQRRRVDQGQLQYRHSAGYPRQTLTLWSANTGRTVRISRTSPPKFGVHRTTAAAHLDRAGVMDRRKTLTEAQIEEAARLLCLGMVARQDWTSPRRLSNERLLPTPTGRRTTAPAAGAFVTASQRAPSTRGAVLVEPGTREARELLDRWRSSTTGRCTLKPWVIKKTWVIKAAQPGPRGGRVVSLTGDARARLRREGTERWRL